jgi:hypothetical protein
MLNSELGDALRTFDRLSSRVRMRLTLLGRPNTQAVATFQIKETARGLSGVMTDGME